MLRKLALWVIWKRRCTITIEQASVSREETWALLITMTETEIRSRWNTLAAPSQGRHDRSAAKRRAFHRDWLLKGKIASVTDGKLKWKEWHKTSYDRRQSVTYKMCENHASHENGEIAQQSEYNSMDCITDLTP